MLKIIINLIALQLLMTISVMALDFVILYKNETPISSKKICVIFEEEDLKLRQEFEIALVQNISRYNHVSAYPAIQLFPPKQTWDEEKIKARLSKMQIESIVKAKFLPVDQTKDDKLQRIEVSMTRLDEKAPMVVLGSRGNFQKDDESIKKNFIKEFASGISTILFDEGYIYDCQCGEGYKNLLKQ